MNPLLLIEIFLTILPIGFLAALVGIGGGVIIVPLLIIFFHMKIKDAISVSIITVIATGITSSSRYLKQKITNLRLGIFLEMGSALGSLTGALIAISIPSWILYIAFSLLLFYLGFVEIFTSKKEELKIKSDEFKKINEDKLSKIFHLSNSYFDIAEGKRVKYNVSKTHLGILLSYFAGLASGIFGIGGGVIKVPIMNNAMGIPLKAAVATSKFMIGITASVAATVYLFLGRINYEVLSSTALGIALGAFLGTKVMNKVKVKKLKIVFGLVLIFFAYLTLLKGIYLLYGLKLPGI